MSVILFYCVIFCLAWFLEAFWSIWSNSGGDGSKLLQLSYPTRWSNLKNSVIGANSTKIHKLGTTNSDCFGLAWFN